MKVPELVDRVVHHVSSLRLGASRYMHGLRDDPPLVDAQSIQRVGTHLPDVRVNGAEHGVAGTGLMDVGST